MPITSIFGIRSGFDTARLKDANALLEELE